MENFCAGFPRHGNFSRHFSTAWKKSFHAVENGSAAWKTLLVGGALILAGCSPPDAPLRSLSPGEDAAARAVLSAETIRIGDPVHLTLTVLHREGTTVDIPSIAKERDILVRDISTAQTPLPHALVRTEQTVQFTSMTITNHILAEGAEITVSTPEGLRWTIPFPFAAIEVVTSLAPGETDPRPAKAEPARWPAPPSRWIWVALIVLALIGAAWVALYRFLTTPRTILHMAPPVPPHQVALDAMATLRAKGWIEALNFEPFYVELSGIVRRYIEDRFGLRAPERTTEEFIRDALTSRELSDAHRDRVAGFLEQSDLVKFARHAPGQADMRNAIESGERLVRETTLVAPDTGPASSPRPGVASDGVQGRTASLLTQGHGVRNDDQAPSSLPMTPGRREAEAQHHGKSDGGAE